jgi:hypothetical protein
MRWQYKVSFLLLLLSQTAFLGLAAYFTDNQVYYSNNDSTAVSTIGYSWIWYHPQEWTWVLPLAVLALVFFLFGLVRDTHTQKMD